MWHDEVPHFPPGRQIGSSCTRLFRGFRVLEFGHDYPEGCSIGDTMAR